MRGINLKILSVDELLDIAGYINMLLKQRGAELRQKLVALGSSSGAAKSARGSKIKGRKIAPKYRNPETGETWAGRGMRPRWLKGRKLEDFVIGKPAGRQKRTAKRRSKKKAG